MRRVVQLLGDHTQELGLVLAAVVVGGADADQLGERGPVGCGSTAIPQLRTSPTGREAFRDTQPEKPGTGFS